MRIERIAVRPLRHMPGRRTCVLRVGGFDCEFPFRDLVEFSEGVADVLKVTEGLVATNAAHPEEREHLQLEGLRVQDSVEHNRNMISGREARERTAEGEHIAAGDWYAEVSMNGTDTDCSFNTTAELYQIVQGIIKREMANHGQLITQTPAVLSHIRVIRHA